LFFYLHVRLHRIYAHIITLTSRYVGPRVCADRSIFSFTAAVLLLQMVKFTIGHPLIYVLLLFLAVSRQIREPDSRPSSSPCVSTTRNYEKTLYRAAVCKRRRLDNKKKTSCILYISYYVIYIYTIRIMYFSTAIRTYYIYVVEKKYWRFWTKKKTDYYNLTYILYHMRVCVCVFPHSIRDCKVLSFTTSYPVQGENDILQSPTQRHIIFNPN